MLKYRNVSWRHDVDYSLDAALQMSEFEHKRGISAHFYLFFEENYPFYSINEAIFAANWLAKDGHIVGRHVDERLHPPSTLGDCYVSFHCPTEAVLWKDFPNFHNAYSSNRRGHYYSDSRGEIWPYHVDHLMLGQNFVEVNLHPEWWFRPNWMDEVDDETYKRVFYSEKPVRSEF